MKDLTQMMFDSQQDKFVQLKDKPKPGILTELMGKCVDSTHLDSEDIVNAKDRTDH